MTTAVTCGCPGCTQSAPSEYGICDEHRREAEKAGATIRKLTFAEQVNRNRQPDREAGQ
jgi:hypothetical protein